MEIAEKGVTAKSNKLNFIIDKMRKFSSDIAFYQVLVSASAWQALIGRDVFQKPSDKQIRQAYDSICIGEKQISGSENSRKKR